MKHHPFDLAKTMKTQNIYPQIQIKDDIVNAKLKKYTEQMRSADLESYMNQYPTP